MADLRPDTPFETTMRVLLNLAGLGLTVGLVVLTVATIIHEAG